MRQIEDKPGNLTGTVRNEHGVTIKNALITTDKGHETSSGQNGTYTIKKILPGEYRLVVKAKGYKGYKTIINISSGKKEVVDYILKQNGWWVYLYDTWLKKIIIMIVTLASIAITKWSELTTIKAANQNDFKEGILQPKPIRSSGSNVEIRTIKNKPIFKIPQTGNTRTVKGLYWRRKSIGIGFTINGGIVLPSLDSLHNGIEFQLSGDCDTSSAIIGVILKNDSLYFSTEFHDLQNQNRIGVINFNHWSLYKPNYLYEYSDQNRLEVRDKQGLIVFSAIFDYSQKLFDLLIINGYFISPRSVSIIAIGNSKTEDTDTCFSKSDPNWQVKTWEIVKEIQTIFPEKPKL